MNHLPSARAKARGRTYIPATDIAQGDLVYLKGDKNKLKARERYLVVGVDQNQMCDLRNFASSQLRSKVYSVPMSECYPVSSNVLAQIPQGPIRGQNLPPEPDSDTDTDTFTPPPDPQPDPPEPPTHMPHPTCVPPVSAQPTRPAPPLFPAQPPVPAAIVVPNTRPVSDTDSAVLPAAAHSPHASEPLRRSTRHRRPPEWHNQDWLFD